MNSQLHGILAPAAPLPEFYIKKEEEGIEAVLSPTATPAEKAGGVICSAAKTREAQKKCDEQFKEGLEEVRNNEKEWGDLNREAECCDNKVEEERKAFQKLKDEEHEYNLRVNKEIHEKCYEAEKTNPGVMNVSSGNDEMFLQLPRRLAAGPMAYNKQTGPLLTSR